MTAAPDAGPRRIVLPEIDSTNAEALRRAAAGEPGPLWLRAERQTAGRGRRGRGWLGPRGALLATGLYRERCGPAGAAQLSFCAALAAAETARWGRLGSRVTLKWPNDVLLDGGKVAGVLLESVGDRAGVAVAVGVGLNLASAPDGLERPVAAVGAALDQPAPDPDAALDVLIAAFERRRAVWLAEGFAPIRTAWLAETADIGVEMTAQAAGGTIAGRFVDLGGDGAMVLETPTGRVRVTAGEVERARRAAPTGS